MEKEDNYSSPESNDNIALVSDDGNASQEDIQALINSVLEKLANIADQTVKAQQDIDGIKNKIDMETEGNKDFGKSNSTTAVSESNKPNGKDDIPVLIKSTESNDIDGTEDLCTCPKSNALITSVEESLSNIAKQTAEVQQEMETIKDLVKRLDDKDPSFSDIPEPKAPGPGRPLPDFPNPYPDPQPDPFNDPRPGPFWDDEDN